MENVVYIRNVSFKYTQDDLYKFFIRFGPIKRVKIFSLLYDGSLFPVGYACVQFLDNHGYNKCISFEQNLNTLDIYSKKPETPFPRSIFVFFMSDIVNEEFISSFFQQNQPSKISILSTPSIHNYGFSIVEFSSVESRDIVLYDYFRNQSLNINSTRSNYNLLTIIEPPTDLIDLSINRKNTNKSHLSTDPNLSNHNEINANNRNFKKFTNFNEKGEYNSPSIPFSPTGVSYFENKYYERYLDLIIVHNKIEYRVNSFLASSFSMKIKKFLMENSIIERINTRFDKEGPFELISNSLLGLPIDITCENSVFLFIASSDLEIENLKRSSYGYVFNQMTIEKAFELHRYLRIMNVYEGPHSDYLSLNFDQILPNLKIFFSGNFFNKEKVTKNDEHHDLCFLSAILRSKLFTVKDSRLFSKILLEFIKEKDDCIENQRRKFLIQFLKMNEMNLEEARIVIEDKSLNLNQISKPIYSFLQEKSKEINSKIISNQSNFEIEKVFYQNSIKKNHGIFSKLFQTCGGNPHDLKIINVSASSSSLEEIIDTNDQKSIEFISSNIQNSWICINFLNNPINLTAYAFKYSENCNSGFDSDGYISNQLISWKIEGSNDFKNWIKIDERKNEKLRKEDYDSYSYFYSTESEQSQSISMKKKKKLKKSKILVRFRWKVFQIEKNSENDFFKYIRITQIGKNHSDNYQLKIQGLEFYGSIPDQQIEILYNNEIHSKFQKGIFSCLFDLCEGENPIHNELISICSSCDVKYLIDESYQGYWHSLSTGNAYVKVDLKQMKLELKSYSLKCFNGDKDDFLKSWKVEVSNDDEKWILVDKRENRSEYKNPVENYFWDCGSPYIDPIRYIRICNMDKSNSAFCIANIELYGILYRPKNH